MTPSDFQSPRTLRRLNIVAVALAMASVTGSIFGSLDSHVSATLGAVTTATTLLLGAIWAWLMRGEKTVGRSGLRIGWLASIPLAALNAGLAMSLLLIDRGTGIHLDRFASAIVVGATFGSIVWIPALIVTLLCFGAPIAWAQRLAKRGLAGEERGEKIVGSVAALISVIAILITLNWSPLSDHAVAAAALMRLLAVMGVASGGGAAMLASAREERRRAFVAAAESGQVPNYRVDTTDEGKVLMRVVSHGDGYRVGNFDEPLIELDANGNVKQTAL